MCADTYYPVEAVRVLAFFEDDVDTTGWHFRNVIASDETRPEATLSG